MCFEEAAQFPVTLTVTTRVDLASVFKTGSYFPRDFATDRIYTILVSKDSLMTVT